MAVIVNAVYAQSRIGAHFIKLADIQVDSLVIVILGCQLHAFWGTGPNEYSSLLSTSHR